VSATPTTAEARTAERDGEIGRRTRERAFEKSYLPKSLEAKTTEVASQPPDTLAVRRTDERKLLPPSESSAKEHATGSDDFSPEKYFLANRIPVAGKNVPKRILRRRADLPKPR